MCIRDRELEAKREEKFFKQLGEHNKRRSEAIMNITSKRMKGSSMWTSGTKTASNLDFEHPGDDKDVELAQLWELQEEIPTMTVTRSMVDAAIAVRKWNCYLSIMWI